VAEETVVVRGVAETEAVVMAAAREAEVMEVVCECSVAVVTGLDVRRYLTAAEELHLQQVRFDLKTK